VGLFGELLLVLVAGLLGVLMTPRLDLHGFRHHEVQNEVARFLESHLTSGLFLEIITGNSQIMLQESVKIIQQYGLQYHTGFPHHIGRILVATYDDLY
jgi:hypothetical protein